MADCCSRFVVAIVIVLLCIGLGGIICGGVGTKWYTESSSHLNAEIGMWKSCTELVCERRSDLLQFKTKESYYIGIEGKCK